MNWEDIDCEDCGTKPSSAVMRLASKLGRPSRRETSAVAWLTRVVVPPYVRVDPKTGKRENVDGYTYERKGAAPSAPSGSTRARSVPSAPDRPKGASAGPKAAPSKKAFTSIARKQAARGLGRANTQKGAAQVPGLKKANITGPKAAAGPQNVPDIPDVDLKVDSGAGTEDDPFQTTDVDTAAALIMVRGANPDGTPKDPYYVQLKQERQVSTLLDRVKALVDDAKAKGEDAPVYDLCKVSVPGTNLFCADNKGIPRASMPQLTSDHPRPGSEADKMERDDIGEVNLSEQYVEHLANDLGINVAEEDVDPAFLRATQRELNGAKVAKLAGFIAEGGYNRDKPIFVTRDDYVVDGHHRWAGAIGAEFKTGQDLQIPVRRIDLDITDVLMDCIEWTRKMGIPPESAAEAASSMKQQKTPEKK